VIAIAGLFVSIDSVVLKSQTIEVKDSENAQPASAVSASRTDSSRGEDGLRRGERSRPNVQFSRA